MKKIRYLIWGIFSSFLFSKIVFAAGSAKLNFCEESGVQRAFQILGYALFILKIIIPIIIIIFGIIDFAKAIIASDDSAIKKSTTTLIKRVIAGVIIFLIPTIIYFAFELIDGYSSDDSTYYKCINCMTNPTKCNPNP